MGRRRPFPRDFAVSREVSDDPHGFHGLRSACGRASARMVSFGPALRFLGDTALVVPVDGVEDLAELTGRAWRRLRR
jgi:hypothetical protein